MYRSAPPPIPSPVTEASMCPTPAWLGSEGTYISPRGQNQLNGAEADVNMKTGIATLLSRKTGRVRGLVVPNDESNKTFGADPVATVGGDPAKKPASPPARQQP